MHPIIYDVAVSADGFIAGPNADISAFPSEGDVLSDYLARLQSYKTVLMGRATYEFGYDYGLAPGDNPYPWAESIVVSTGLSLPDGASVTQWRDLTDSALRELRQASDGPIYLCGGGQIDQLRLKRAPILLGGGTPLFDGLIRRPRLTLSDQTDYGHGLIYQAFTVG